MSEQIARYKPGTSVPGFANAQVNAGRFVSVVATKTANGDYPIEHAAAGSNPFGVSEQDSGPTTQDATSAERRVNVVRRGVIARVQASAGITAGEEVEVAAEGKVAKKTTGLAVGRCLTTVVTGAFAEIDLY